MSLVNGDRASDTPDYGSFLTQLRAMEGDVVTSKEFEAEFGSNPIRDARGPSSSGVPSVRQATATSSRAMEAASRNLERVPLRTSSPWSDKTVAVLPSEEVSFDINEQGIAEHDNSSNALNSSHAPASHPAPKQVLVSRWSQLSGWQKVGVIASLIILPIGVGLLVYMHCSKVPVPLTEGSKGVSPPKHTVPSVKVPKIRQQMKQSLSAQGLRLEFSVDPTTRAARTRKEEEISKNAQALKDHKESIGGYCATLAKLAEGSGKTEKDFREKIEQGLPILAMGLKYYRVIQGSGQIPQKQKEEIEGLYADALAVQKEIDAIPENNKKLQRQILTDDSCTVPLEKALDQQLPYQLQIEGKKFEQSVYRGNRISFTNIDKAQLSPMLAKWAGNRGHIELSDSDPAFVAQHYLAELAHKEPLVLSDEERRALNKSGMHLKTLPKTHKVELLSTSQGTYVIESTRQVEMRPHDDTVKATYDWGERITLTPNQNGCAIEIERSVKKI